MGMIGTGIAWIHIPIPACGSSPDVTLTRRSIHFGSYSEFHKNMFAARGLRITTSLRRSSTRYECDLICADQVETLENGR
jgi:hypothetical protein